MLRAGGAHQRDVHRERERLHLACLQQVGLIGYREHTAGGRDDRGHVRTRTIGRPGTVGLIIGISTRSIWLGTDLLANLDPGHVAPVTLTTAEGGTRIIMVTLGQLPGS